MLAIFVAIGDLAVPRVRSSANRADQLNAVTIPQAIEQDYVGKDYGISPKPSALGSRAVISCTAKGDPVCGGSG